MNSLKTTMLAALLGLALTSSASAGTITGSRATRTGTITGSRAGTITGSRAGTITGSRTGTITGSSVRTESGTTTDDSGALSRTFREEMYSYVLSALLQFAW
jgi:hypothetical protein